jgi:hypothetical protein
MSEKAELSDEFKAFKESLIQNTEISVFFFKLIMSYLDNIESDKDKLRELSIDKLRELDEKVIIWLRGYEHARLLRWLLGVTITSSADTFDYYLSQILLKVFTKRPDIFRASEYKAEVREFIEAGSVPEFMRRFAEKRVNELSYMGLPKIIEYLNNRLGLEFDIKDSSFQAACEIMEVRNILVHNAGRVNKLFLQRTGRTDLHEGDLYPLTFDYQSGAFKELVIVAMKLDMTITSHFNLNQEWSL